MTAQASSTLEIARGYLAAGLGVLPIRPDGSKSPPLPKGHPFLKERPTDADLVQWFADGRNGIAIPGGKVSGNLETLDFETATVYLAWRELVNAQIPGLVERLCWCKTPGHLGERGLHARYRCPGVGPLKTENLAHEPELDEWGVQVLDAKTGRPKARLLIETRSEGGYAVAPGSPPECHSTRRLWEHVAGPDLRHVPDVTMLEREVMLSSARALNSWIDESDIVAAKPAPARQGGGLSPGDDYSRRGPDWAEVLGDGWLCVRTSGDVRYWRRPGKSNCWSATTGFCKAEGIDLLHVFSGNAQPFKQGGSYSKFRALALLHHRGDFSETARVLGKQGFGEQLEGKRAVSSPPSSPAAHEKNGKAHAEPNKEEAWDKPIPLSEIPDTPLFPTNILPRWLAEFVAAEARATQTPPDVAGLLAIGFCGAALAGRFRIAPRPGWTEPTNLYVVAVLPPGNRKSAVFADLVKPVQEYERGELTRSRPALAAAASDRQVLEGRLKAAIQDAAKADEEERGAAEERARELARELAEADRLVPPQVYADDCTPEKLAGILAEQGGRLLVTSAEGTIFEIAKGRYADSPNFDVFLKAHSGDSIRVHRVGREPDCVDDPALSLAVTVQPSVISGLAEHASLRGRGFTARFLYGVPVSLLGRRKAAQPPVPAFIAKEYQERMLAMWALTGGVGEDCKPQARLISFSPEAETVLRSFEEWIEPKLGEDGDLCHLADWASKLAGALVRIAGILHVAGQIESGDFGGQVQRQTVEAAAHFASEYLLPHALIAHALLGSDARVVPARKVLAWLKRENRRSFTKRDAHRAMPSQFKQAEELDPVLEMLTRHAWVRADERGEKRGPGRPASQVYEVNPALFESPIDS